MSDLASIKIEPEHIAHLLADRNWTVPRYQRGYKWGERQVQDLLNDIESAIQEKQTEYFLGSIVAATGEHDLPEIVDGQQRLATISILIAAIRDFFFTELKDTETATLIQTKYLLQKDIETKDENPKLRLSSLDHDFFLRKILEPPSTQRKALKAEKDSHKRILEASQSARSYLAKITSGINKPEQLLHERIKYLFNRTLVILVRVPNQQNAFTIFETLNDRGLDLAITDLLKNFLFHRSQDRINEVQHKWLEMLTTIETSVDEESVKDYLRHQWSSEHGLTRERELFQKIKDSVTTKKLAVEYAEKLRAEAELYAAIHNQSHEFWKGYASSDKQHIYVITELLGLEQRITPLLLSILSRLPKKEISLSLKMIVGWGVRILVAHSVAGQLEKKYSEAAVKIRQGAITTAKGLFAEMQEAIPSDLEFEKAFGDAKVSKSILARYYLRALEKAAKGESQPELVANPDESEVNLEHVLPQNRAAGTWKNFSDEQHEDYRFRLGNLALMKQSENGNIGAEEFAVKRAKYQKSALTLTSIVGAETTWGAAQIDARQKVLAKHALTVWPAKTK